MISKIDKRKRRAKKTRAKIKQLEAHRLCVHRSSNHIYAFCLISFIGLFAFESKKRLFIYLFFLSIILEFLHLFIPNRSFQMGDLNGNLLGVIIPFLTYKIYEFLFQSKKE